jgi:hypothetical protein
MCVQLMWSVHQNLWESCEMPLCVWRNIDDVVFSLSLSSLFLSFFSLAQIPDREWFRRYQAILQQHEASETVQP